ncbi:DUF3108 domain-containing protein [Pseudoxanthobacter sp.]|uniref:DUF3108 domain-containing protein n=1 Tax=Pseudoxanthobacter sp. TaxID=1925742 RepID=UPI002FE1FF70
MRRRVLSVLSFLAPALAVAGGLAAAPRPAAAESIRVGGIYAVTFSGVPVGRATFSLVSEEGAYSIRIALKPAAVGKVVAAGNFRAESTGWLHEGRVLPTRFTLESVDTESENRVEMHMADGAVLRSEAEPALPEREARVPLTDVVMSGGILDPVSAALVLVPAGGGNAPPKAACDGRLPIFDGWTRYDIRLSYRETEEVVLPTFEGQAVVCQARWVPVAGHIPGRKAVEFMKNNRRISVSYVPVGRSGLMVPYRIEMKTLYGTLMVAAEDLKMTGPIMASAAQ